MINLFKFDDGKTAPVQHTRIQGLVLLMLLVILKIKPSFDTVSEFPLYLVLSILKS